MPKKKIKFGILGLGRVIEKRLVDVFKHEVTDAEVSAVFDNNLKKNKKFSKIFKCKFSNTFKDFIKTKLDIIYIATESGNHFKNISDCFLAKKPLRHCLSISTLSHLF